MLNEDILRCSNNGGKIKEIKALTVIIYKIDKLKNGYRVTKQKINLI